MRSCPIVYISLHCIVTIGDKHIKNTVVGEPVIILLGTTHRAH